MTRKPRPAKLSEAEKAQVRARKAAGHDFALKRDGFGRDRLVEGTAEARRELELTTAGFVRVSTVDPLKDSRNSLTAQQRAAGEQYRSDFDDMLAAQKMQTGSWVNEPVDGGSIHHGIAIALLSAIEAHQRAVRAMGHPDIVEVVNAVCGASFAISEHARRKRESREAVVALLKIGLDLLAEHYGITGNAHDHQS